MMKIRILVFVILLGFASAPASAATMLEDVEDISWRWGVGFNGSWNIPQSDEFDFTDYLGAQIILGLDAPWAVTMEVGRFTYDAEAFSIHFGELEGTPWIWSLQYRYPFKVGTSKSAFYASVGAGLIIFEFDNASVVTSNASLINPKDAFALKVAAGFEFFWDDHLAGFIEGSHTFTDTDVTLTHAGLSDTTTENTDYWLIGGGVRYYL